MTEPLIDAAATAASASAGADGDAAPTAGSGPEARWVLQRMDAATTRLGRVLREDATGLTVAFGPDAVFDWETLPKSAMFVEHGSLAWRSVAERAELHAEFAAAPVTVVLAVLREAGQPLDAGDVRARLVGLGLLPSAVRPGQTDPWKDLWKDVQQRLRTHEHVERDESGKAYAWREVARPTSQRVASTVRVRRERVGAERALALLASRATPPNQREALIDELQATHRAGGLTATQAAVAYALRALPPAQLDLAGIDVTDGVPDAALEPLIRLARGQGAWPWVVATMLRSGRGALAELAHEFWRDPPPVAGPILASVLVEVRGDATSVTERLANLPAALAARPSLEAATAGLAALGAAAEQDRPAALVAVIAASVSALPDDLLADAVDLVEPGPAGALCAALAGRAVLDPPRLRLLAAVARSAPAAVGAREVWDGLDLPALAVLARDPALASVLADAPLATTVTRPVLGAACLALDGATLVALLALPPVLQAFVPGDVLVGGIERLRADLPLLGALLDAARSA